MRQLTVVGHPDDSAVRPHRLKAWWSTRGDTLELFFYTILLPVDFLALLAAFATAFALPRRSGTETVASGGFDHFFWVFLAVIAA